MAAIHLASTVDEPVFGRRFRLLATGGMLLAMLVAVMSLGGLADPSTYERETTSWTVQAIAQDWFDLVIAVPALVVTAVWGARGSRRGLLTFAGTILFTVYTAVIYAFGIHLNALFLVYCAALGLGLYTLIGTCARLWQARSIIRVSTAMPRRLVGGYLIGIGAAFGLLWLIQLVPAAVNGTLPRELAETGLATNPVHVIDLSFILPLHIIAGVSMWRMRSPLVLLAPLVLVFGALMSASIAFLSAYAGQLPVAAALGILTAISSALSVVTLRALR